MQLPAIRPSHARVGALCALVATIVLSLLAPRAEAAVTPISTGGLDWGVKASFRAYIVGSVAHGSIVAAGGATVNPDGTFHFPLAGGAFDDATNTTVTSFGGQVRFTGHDGQLDLTLSDVRVELAPDGTRLLVDLTSVPFPGGGAPVSYPDVELLRLDLAGIDPAIGGGTTRWAAIPTTLTSVGAPAFAGFYGPGQAFDPVTFSYAGPGGKPVPEALSRSGEPIFAADGDATGVGSFTELFVDEANDALHVVTSEGIEAFDLATLEPLASVTTAELDQFAIAFDPETATVFVKLATGAADVLSYRYDAGAGAYVRGAVALTPYALLDYDPATDRLWSIDSWNVDPAVEVATRDGGGWRTAAYPPLDTDGRYILNAVRSAEGTLVATFWPDASFVPPSSVVVNAIYPAAAIEDTGSALEMSDVPGTLADDAFGTTYGYANLGAAPDGGRLLVTEDSPLLSAKRTLTLVPSAANPSGWAVAGDPLVTTPDLSSFLVDRVADWDYGVFADRVDVYRRGEAVGSIPTGPAVELEAGSRALYAADNGSGTLTRWAYAGSAPEIAEQPASQAVELSSADGAKPVTFTASATAASPPAVRWQRRAPGELGWTDVPGATATTLQVEATVARAGTRYRAVFEGVVGSVASDAATLSVSVVPPRAEPPVDPPVVHPPLPPAPPAPPVARRPAPKPPLLGVVGRRATVGRGGTATLATLGCRRGGAACRVSAPRRVKVTIDGTTYWARVLTPARLRAGAHGAIRVRLGSAARRALAGRSTSVRVHVAIRAGGQRTERTLRVRLARP